MRIKLRKKTDPWSRFKELYEWNPGNGAWYPVHRRNIIFGCGVLHGSERRIFNGRIGEFFNKLLKGETLEVAAVYSKPALTILSLSPISVSTDSNVPEQKNAVKTAAFHGRGP